MDASGLRKQLMTNQLTLKKPSFLQEYIWGDVDMEDGAVDIGDTEGSVDDGAGVKELTAEEQAAEAEWQEAEAMRAKIRERGRIRAATYREKHPDKIKERNEAHYQKNKYEIRAQQNERNAELRLARGGANAAGAARYTFAVRAGCRLECNPGHCAACALAWNEGRHPVHARIRKAYEVETQDELPMPVDAQEDAAFLHGLQRLWGRHDCSDDLVTRQKCRFHGECQRCTAVKRREQEQASAKNQFYEPHREEVRLSKERVRSEWRNWMDSWNSDRSEASGVRWRQDFERQLAEATARRG